MAECLMQGPEGFVCTESEDHIGDHIARGVNGEECERWPLDVSMRLGDVVAGLREIVSDTR